jgi:hypothetical protein
MNQEQWTSIVKGWLSVAVGMLLCIWFKCLRCCYGCQTHRVAHVCVTCLLCTSALVVL